MVNKAIYGWICHYYTCSRSNGWDTRNINQTFLTIGNRQEYAGDDYHGNFVTDMMTLTKDGEEVVNDSLVLDGGHVIWVVGVILKTQDLELSQLNIDGSGCP